MFTNLLRIRSLEKEEIVISQELFDKVVTRNMEFIIVSIRNSRHILLPYPSQTIINFVNYVERDDPEFTSVTQAFDLYRLSKKFQIENLRRKCRIYLIKEISLNNVCSIHDFACEVKDTDIIYYCWKAFDKYGEYVFRTRDFLLCKSSTINTLVSRPICESITEISLLLGVYHWCEERVKYETGTKAYILMKKETKRLKIRDVFEPFIEKIRFLAMSVSERKISGIILNFLTNTEKGLLRFASETQDYSNYPTYFSKETRTRCEENYYDLIDYNNYNNEHFTRISNENRKPKLYFSCEVILSEDSYLTELLLPINLSRDSAIMQVFGYIKTLKSDVHFFYTVCNREGIAKLERCFYLKKDMLFRFIAFFVDIENFQSTVNPLSLRSILFENDEETEKIMFEQLNIKIDKSIYDNISFELKFYF
ncbi:uncharacterized protein LOC111636012 [Centruroides sculpturatus]|uniref:uncharacterized protein LOC111636006 n=1 Tax=Centruroides sculpturatus TaxID=218467 RepID=UPI000C6D586C|nr:uncharacterized protein LOC111636006 [Centruroides sculpturatus]XP_023236932.1 uncharacterized protein LOC111636012 [Centruroides sculpturatus]